MAQHKGRLGADRLGRTIGAGLMRVMQGRREEEHMNTQGVTNI